MFQERLNEIAGRIRETVARVVIGQKDAVDLILVALLAQGHVLFEGVPGTAKTLLAQTFARTLDLEFNRIQFTPDLMPGDVLGTNLFNFQTNEFVLKKGPIFTEILLADEINRTPPKTQAALLEAMQERRITIDGEHHPLGDAFMVIATQNPVEHEGTYPLPEAQLDRFLLKVTIDYPTRDSEREMVRVHGNRSAMPSLDDLGIEAVATAEAVREARSFVSGLHLSDPITDYVVDIVRKTREHPSLRCGASPRAANLVAAAARARAALEGRDYVIPDDVQVLAVPALAHRLLLAPGAEIEGLDTRTIVTQVIEQVPAPR